MKEPVKISATEVHRHFSDLIRRAVIEKERFLVEKDGLPVMVMLSVDDYVALIQDQPRTAEEKLRRFEANARAIGEEFAQLGLSEEEMLEQLDAFRKERRRDGTSSR